MQRQGYYTKQQIKALAIRGTIARLKDNPAAVEEFVKDMATSEYKKWDAYKCALSDAILDDCKGRAVPTRASKGGCASPNDNIRLAKLSIITGKEANTIGHYNSLHLNECKNDKEKIARILKANIPAQMKAELLQVNIK